MSWDTKLKGVTDMQLYKDESDCCIFSVLHGLYNYPAPAHTGDEILKDFVKTHTQDNTRYGGGQKFNLRFNIYVFAGPVHGKCDHGYAGYAQNFANLIRKENLGFITETPETENTKWHKGRIGQCFMWVPDAEKVKAYAEKKGWLGEKAKVVPVGDEIPENNDDDQEDDD